MLGRGGVWTSALTAAVDAAGGKYVRTTRFVSIGAGTSGTVTLPSNAAVVLNDFGGTVDAVVLQISSGSPLKSPALTATGTVVSATFDSSGNWVFSGAPVAYPVALVYRVQQTLSNFDSTSSDIWGDSEVNTVINESLGGTNQSSYTLGDLLYSSAANVLSKLAGQITTTPKYLRQVGNGAVSAAPSWIQPAFSELSGSATAAQLPSLLSSSGSLATMNALTGTDGQMFWNTTYKAMFVWVVNRWIPYGIIDPRYGFSIYEEFHGFDRIGQLDWQTPGGAPPFAGNLLNSGIYEITQSTAAAQNNLRLSLNTTQLGTMDFYFEVLCSIPTLATVGEDFCLTIGLNDSASYNANGTCTDGAFIQLNRAVNVKKWIYATTNNTTATATNSSSPDVVAAQWYRVSGYINAGVSFAASVDGTSLGTAISTNLPTGAGRQTGFIIKVDKTAGSAASAVDLDYVWLYGFYNGARAS